MYSRSYYPESERMSLPDNYDGTAFIERPTLESAEEPVEPPVIDNADSQVFKGTDEHRHRQQSSIEGIPLLSGIFGKGGLFGGLGLHSPTIGTEEILILAMAAFLFFSKSGDRECALILLLLIFIN